MDAQMDVDTGSEDPPKGMATQLRAMLMVSWCFVLVVVRFGQ